MHDTLTLHDVKQVRIPLRQRQLNGKAEEFNRTLLDEWAHVLADKSEDERVTALSDWIHTYCHHRNPADVGGPLISRATKVARHHS
jgi:transposase InsO family protein